MDFLDPKKQKAHTIRLRVGYVLIGLAILLATTILLYQARGYVIDRHGRVIQNGLIFLSSQPEGADIYANNKMVDGTNARMVLPAGQYVFELKRTGYRDWKRGITIEGGSVQRFDYPFLFPTSLKTSVAKQYGGAPGFSTQSLDRRWLMVQTGANDFDLYDLRDEAPVPDSFTISPEVLSAGSVTTSWQTIEWSDDDRHVVLSRLFTKDGQPGREYILVDREKPAETINLSVLLGFTPTTLQLRDQAYDQYYLFDQPNGALLTASIEKPTPQPYLSRVLAFKAHGKNTVVYATNKDMPADKASVRVRDGDQTFTIRQVAVSPTYLLDINRFDDNWFVAAGSANEDRVYVYKNPMDRLREVSNSAPVPSQVLKVVAPNYLSFSTNGRYVVLESADSFAVYDAKTDKGYAYQSKLPIDPGIGHATWIDGYHLSIVSGGQLAVMDFDGTNQQQLVPSSPAFAPFFTPDFKRLYTLADSALTITPLRTPEDL